MKKKILFVLHLLAGLMFMNAGLDKFFHYMPMPKEMPEKIVKVGMAFMEIGWLMPLVGSAELTGGLLLIIPRTRALGALILCPVLAGILLANISMAPSGLPIALALLAIIVWGMYENRAKYLPLISRTNV
jgi:uncharacterized membrane protein YphA (DoxX/SURF4 family)